MDTLAAPGVTHFCPSRPVRWVSPPPGWPLGQKQAPRGPTNAQAWPTSHEDQTLQVAAFPAGPPWVHVPDHPVHTHLTHVSTGEQGRDCL